MSEPLPDPCQVVAWRPAVPGISEVFHARIADYRYPKHSHDTWTVLIVDRGALGYDIDTHHHGAVGESVSILPPGVTHNGYPAERTGSFRKRNLYLDSSFLPEDLIGHAVDASTFQDAELRAAISALHDRLIAPRPTDGPSGAPPSTDGLPGAPPSTDGLPGAPDLLDVEARLALIAERFRRRLQRRPPVTLDPEPAVADHLRQYLDGHVTDTVTLDRAAGLLGRSVPHLVRSFTKRYGISPHAYVIAKRIESARGLLLQGVPAARVAADVGFHDQAHLTRHFKRHVSVTPARYAAGPATAARP